MSTVPVYVGIDVAQETFDVAVHDGEYWTDRNDASGIADTTARLQSLKPALVVLEATGGLERSLVRALDAVGIEPAVMNPSRIRAYAKALGHLAKTDKIDARVIAHFAQAIRPTPRARRSAGDQELKDLLARRGQLMGMITAEKNRLYRATPAIQVQIKDHIAWMEQQVAQIDRDLSDRMAAEQKLQQRQQQLCTVIGIGPYVSRTLIIDLPELGRLTGKQVAALVGVVPFNRDSGKFTGKRFVTGGRPVVRTALFIAAMVAKRWNPVIKALYDRLIKAGKCKKVAIVACAHKLLLIVNAMVRDGTFWQPVAA